MLDESDATRLWQRLFRSQTVTSETLKEAEAVVSQLKPESPLRFRYAAELEEIRTLHRESSRKE